MKNPKYLWVGAALAIVAMAFVNFQGEQQMAEIHENGGRRVEFEPSADLPPSIVEEFEVLVTAEGSGEQVAKAGDIVAVHYTGTLEDGTKFDSSRDRGEPIEFPLGQGRVIRGWDLGITGMKVGEQRKLTIPAELGYGSRGAGDVIPPDATLIFETELVAIK